MTILLALAFAQAAAAPAVPPAIDDPALPLRILPPQELPATGCALFLWQQGPERRLLMMARTDNGTARVALETGPLDLRATAAGGPIVLGFAQSARFSDGRTTLDWGLAIEQRADIADGGVVSGGMLTVTRAGHDQAVIPVTGIVGCRPQDQG